MSAVLFLFSATLYAETITVNLSQSNEIYSLIGTGGSGGYGTYLAQQGNCSSGATQTVCTLTGAYTGSTPGFTSGNYLLTTTYDQADGGLPATSTTPTLSASGGNYFHFDPFSSDVQMSLLLTNLTGDGLVPIVINGNLVAESYFLSPVNSVCSGLPAGVACTQGNVGVYNGATISSPILAGVVFDSTDVAQAPEPEWLALGGMVPVALMAVRRRFNRAS